MTAAASQQFTIPRGRPLSDPGKIMPGAKLYFYLPATTTPQTVYTDAAATTPHASPVVADANGAFAAIYLTVAVKAVLKTSADAVVWTEENIPCLLADITAVTTAYTAADTAITAAYTAAITAAIAAAKLALFPVGSLYVSAVATNPASLLGFGTWSAFALGRTLVGVGTGVDDRSESRAFTLAEQSGRYNHPLAESEMPLHGHPMRVSINATISATSFATGGMMLSTNAEANYAAYTGATSVTAGQQVGGTGGAGVHTNMMPYQGICIWQRTA